MNRPFVVEKSAVVLFLMGLAGVLLLLTAADLVWLHDVSAAPLVDDNGNITTKGSAWLRTDVLWAATFGVVGVFLVWHALTGLARSRPVGEVTANGLRFRVARGGESVALPWSDVTYVKSLRTAGDGVHRRPVVVVGLADSHRVPYDLRGAQRWGHELHVDAEGWSEAPEEFVVRACIELERARAEAVGVAAGPADDETGEGSP